MVLMSRDWGERKAAWEVWIHLHSKDGRKPFGFQHQCGSLTTLPDGELGSIMCSGCRFEMARPESECIPLYLTPSPENCDCAPIRSIATDELTWVPGVRPCRLHPRKGDFGPERGEWLQPNRHTWELSIESTFMVAFEWRYLWDYITEALSDAFEAKTMTELSEAQELLCRNLDLARWRKVPTDG